MCALLLPAGRLVARRQVVALAACEQHRSCTVWRCRWFALGFYEIPLCTVGSRSDAFLDAVPRGQLGLCAWNCSGVCRVPLPSGWLHMRVVCARQALPSIHCHPVSRACCCCAQPMAVCVGAHWWCPRCWAVCRLAAAPGVSLAGACVTNCPSVFVYGMRVELISVWCVGKGAVDNACSGEVYDESLETQVFTGTTGSGLLYMRRNSSTRQQSDKHDWEHQHTSESTAAYVPYVCGE